MASLLVVLIIAGCAVYQYFKGTVVRAFATLIIAICAGIVTLAYYEVLADVIISRGRTRLPALVPWAQTIAFALLFILTFAILQTLASYLTRQPVDLGDIPESVGRVACGTLLGLFISGVLLTALALAPLPNKYPYQRFDQRSPDEERPDKVLLNADGFATGWFGMISKGSLRGKKSFAALHPAFIDQLFLNRHSIEQQVPIITSSPAIELPAKKQMPSWWLAPEDLQDSQGNPLRKSGHDLVIVRVGIRKSAIHQAGTFSLSQLRLICKPKTEADKPYAGKAKNAYPIGYLKSDQQLQDKSLHEPIKITSADFGEQERVKWIDFAFYLPKGFVPVLVEFKLNSIVEVPSRVPAEQAPPAIPFIESAMKEQEQGAAGTDRPSSPSPSPPARRRGLSDISRSIIGDQEEDY